MQFHNQGDALYHWNVDKDREFGNDTELHDVAEAGSAPDTESALTKRNVSLKRSAAMASTIDSMRSLQPSRISTFLDHAEGGRADLRVARVDAGDPLIIADGLGE
jgi:hypothetical protein